MPMVCITKVRLQGNQWYFGAKAHIGMDSKEKVVHSVATSAASVADAHMLSDLPEDTSAQNVHVR